MASKPTSHFQGKVWRAGFSRVGGLELGGHSSTEFRGWAHSPSPQTTPQAQHSNTTQQHAKTFAINSNGQTQQMVDRHKNMNVALSWYTLQQSKKRVPTRLTNISVFSEPPLIPHRSLGRMGRCPPSPPTAVSDSYGKSWRGGCPGICHTNLSELSVFYISRTKIIGGADPHLIGHD